MGVIKKDLVYYELEEVSKHITRSLRNEYISLPSEIADNETNVHSSGSGHRWRS